MSYANTVSKHRRLTILRFLAESPEYTSNASILVEVCNSYGLPSTRDQVTGEIDWLAENGMAIKAEQGDFVVVTATTRGLEIASGRARHDAVQRPRPSA